MKYTTVKQSKQNACSEYNHRQDEIAKLLEQIEAGLAKHNRQAVENGVHWGHVGDMNRIKNELTDIRDRLYGQGEYALQPKGNVVYNRHGKAIKVVVP